MKLCLLFLILSISSCMPFARIYLGVKKSKHLSDKEIIHYVNQFNIPEKEVYKLNVELYQSLIEISDSALQKDLSQPLQVKSFDKNGSKNAHLINCTVCGLPELNWNCWNSFDGFPVTNGKAKPINSPLLFDQELSVILPLLDNFTDTIKDQDEILIVYWNRMMNKRSLELINYIQEYRNKNADKHIQVYYVNTDNFYTELFH